jgi:hypothetical protein
MKSRFSGQKLIVIRGPAEQDKRWHDSCENKELRR